ncbi:MAG: biopolymer transporter ExbD [Sphaerochaeta sp.]|jgi:biopolymer transport protein ExbD
MRKRRDLGQPSDIAFLLIIFFLLLAGINTTQSIALQTRAAIAPQPDSIVVQALLTQQGTVVLENETHTPLSFAQKLTSGTTLHLSVEEETSWQQVVDLLSLSEQRQIAGLSLTLSDSSTTAIPFQQENTREMAP